MLPEVEIIDRKLTPQDVYNVHYTQTAQNMLGRTELLDMLHSWGWLYAHQVNSDQELTHLVAINCKSLPYIKAYGQVIQMDCTYKTNKYKMPLLHLTLPEEYLAC